MKNQENNAQAMMSFLSTKHNDWIRIAKSFTNNREYAEDLVQDAYLRLYRLNKTKEQVSYGNEPNRYFMWTVLYNLHKDNVRHQNSYKGIQTFPLLEYDDTIAENYSGDKHQSFEVIMDKIEDFVSTWDVNDKQLFELYYMQGQSLRKIAEGTGIGLSWIHNSVKTIKEKLTKELGEDVADYFNQDWEYLLDDVA